MARGAGWGKRACTNESADEPPHSSPSPFPQASLPRSGISNLSLIICPGFVATELTPAFFNMGIPFFKLVRKYAPSMTLTGLRGTAAHVAAMVSSEELLKGGDKKWVLACDRIAPAVRGCPPMPREAQDRMWKVCEGWLRVWREEAARKAAAAAGGAART